MAALPWFTLQAIRAIIDKNYFINNYKGARNPPSAATGSSIYGPATTAATLSSAAAFALGAKILGEFESLEAYASDLVSRAEQAWSWANANPSVTFTNSNRVAAGEQEVDDNGRATKKRIAAIYLFAATGKSEYHTFVDNNTPSINWVGPWNQKELRPLLYYASLENATSAVASTIRNQYTNAMADNWNNVANDPYRAYLGASATSEAWSILAG